MLAQIILTFQHRAGVRPYTSSCDFAESCVFTKQSPPLLSCHLKKKENLFLWALLFPKLQSQFAEFLQHNSLKRLRLLNLSTCVGFSTVFFYISTDFSEKKMKGNEIFPTTFQSFLHLLVNLYRF